ncbi:MAG: hypothetical protein ACTSX6_14225, partial [Candidatus Heimdallarchaeaceae archaeon]
MSEALTIAEIRKWLDNPIVKKFLNGAVKEGEDKRPIIESALEHIVFGTECSLSCKFYAWFINFILKKSAKTLGSDPELVL